MTIIFVLLSYILCIFYVKKKMKDSSDKILEEIRADVDKRNLDNLVKLSEKKLNPDSYNKNISNYKEAAGLYAGIRALKSPVETFIDFLEILQKLLTF